MLVSGTHTDAEKTKITELLISWTDGDKASAEKLVPMIYRELRSLAARILADERPEHTLQPTALVNEAYLRLADLRQVQWQGRAHFFALAAKSMRRILVDHARRTRSLKRGGADRKISLDQIDDLALDHSPDLIALDDALTALAEIDALKLSIVELRFFGGLTAKETAEVLGCSTSTVNRNWTMAKAWLRCELIDGWHHDA